MEPPAPTTSPRAAAPPRGWQRLAPSLTHWLWLVVLVLLLTRPWRIAMVSADGDPCMHWRVGEWMLEHHQIIRADVFSHTRFGQPIVSKEWLAEILLALAGRWRGLTGLAIVTALIIATTFALLHRQLLRDGNDLLVATLITLLAMWSATIHWLARPHVFSFLMALLWNQALRRHERDGGTRRLALVLGLLTLVWVNLHGAYLAGFFILGAYWLGALIEWWQAPKTAAVREDAAPPNGFPISGRWEGPRPRGPLTQEERSRPADAGDGVPPTTRQRPTAVGRALFSTDPRTAPSRLRGLTAVAALCAVISLANPSGYQLHLHNLAFIQSRFFTGWLAEYASTNFQSPASTGFLLWLALLFFTLALARPRLTPAAIILLLNWCYFALYAGRNIPLLALLSAPIIAPVLSEFIRGSANRLLGKWRELSARLESLLAVSHGWAPIGAVALTVIVFGPRPIAMPADSWPVAARTFIAAHPDRFRGPMFNQYVWGGYLMEFLPDHLVFVDGRADFYGETLVKEFDDITALHPGWQRILARYDVQWTLMPTDHRLNCALALLPDWEPVYADPVATIFRRCE